MDDADDAVAKILQRLLDQRGLRVKDLMVQTGLSRPTVSRHVNGKVFPNVEDRGKYADALGIAREQFESMWQNERRSRGTNGHATIEIPGSEKLSPARSIPRYHSISASRKDERTGDVSDQVEVSNTRAEFAVKVDGDSMEPVYRHGGTALFSNAKPLSQGGFVWGESYIVYFHDGDTYFAQAHRVERDADKVILRKLNPDRARFPDKIVHKKDVRAIALAVGSTWG